MLNKVFSVFILIVLVSGLALGQHSFSAQQTVTFGVARSHQLQLLSAASSGTLALLPAALSAQGKQNRSGMDVKVTLSTKPQLESLQNVAHRVDGISVGASIPTGGKAELDIRHIQADIRAIQSDGLSLSSTRAVAITITD